MRYLLDTHTFLWMAAEPAKLSVKIAEIVQAEKIPKTNKLLKLQVRLENEERQLVAGIAENYDVEKLIGKQVVIVANLEPVSIRNEISNGMLLAAKDGDLPGRQFSSR